MIRTQGNPHRRKPEAPKPLILWYPVLMTHGDGNVLYKAGSYRGIGSKNVAEQLIKKGMIGSNGVRELPEGMVTVKTNPSEALPEGGRNDKMRELLNDAASKVWKPGMVMPPRVDQPAHGLYENREDALHEVDRKVDQELLALAGEDGVPNPPKFPQKKDGGKK